ncbi:hypothetical protein DFQ27_009796 [Actinomortierella ambigua]|uniref:Deacetylase sirtuin-type domain-containing protein n=1 Tax=Actinomortierella ambigua TaxID=1343610 RepID=A0A9P6UAL7_9FUNG|nr:hypothetical protein DFQ27_009796 [Actinomortierella ambigua]
MLTVELNREDMLSPVMDKHLQTVTDKMLKAKKTIVITGAGISCSSGIPDFRSADGLYNLVKAKYPKTVLKGKDLFDANLFRDCASTAVFYTFISELYRQTLEAKPSATHRFIKFLADKGKLLRCYTQNIDCLEERLDMNTDLVCEQGKIQKDVKVVQLHGSLKKLKCTICCNPYPFNKEYEDVFKEGEAPDCPKCLENDMIRNAMGKRRTATGTLRPDIVLYNENHPFGDAIGTIQVSDLAKSPDVLLVMGTSLKVHGLRLLVRKAAKAVHANKRGGCVILVNKTPVVGKEWQGVFDYFIEGECDAWCHHVEEAMRQVKVQTKLPFKALTKEEVEAQRAAEAKAKNGGSSSSSSSTTAKKMVKKKKKVVMEDGAGSDVDIESTLELQDTLKHHHHHHHRHQQQQQQQASQASQASQPTHQQAREVEQGNVSDKENQQPARKRSVAGKKRPFASIKSGSNTPVSSPTLSASSSVVVVPSTPVFAPVLPSCMTMPGLQDQEQQQQQQQHQPPQHHQHQQPSPSSDAIYGTLAKLQLRSKNGSRSSSPVPQEEAAAVRTTTRSQSRKRMTAARTTTTTTTRSRSAAAVAAVAAAVAAGLSMAPPKKRMMTARGESAGVQERLSYTQISKPHVRRLAVGKAK